MARGPELREGQVAVVTGAARGIGRALARRFAAEGLAVVLGDAETAPLADTADALMAEGAHLLARTVDVSGPAAVRAFADAAYDTFGAVHVLCHDAGAGGVLPTVRAFLPRMLASGDPGHVVIASSGAGGSLHTARAGLLTLTASLRAGLRARHARVSASVLLPGPHHTRLPAEELAGHVVEGIRAGRFRLLPDRRAGRSASGGDPGATLLG